MTNYTVDFTVTLGTTRSIQAESEEEALRVAKRLLTNDKYYEQLIASWYEPCNSGWRFPNEPMILDEEELPEMFVEDYVEWLGFNPWEEQ